MSCLLALILGPLLAADGVGFDLSATAEGRGATAPPAPPGATASASTAGQVNATIGLSVDSGALHLAPTYSAQALFNLTGAAASTASNVIQSGRLLADYRISPLQRLSLAQDFTYGQQNFSPIVAAQPGAPAVPFDARLAVLERLAYISSRTNMLYEHAFSQRLRLDTHGGFVVAGGADRIARDILPIQHGVDAGSSLAWAIPPSDQLSFSVNAAASRFTNGQEDAILTLNGGWGTELSRLTKVDASIGGGVAGSRCWWSVDKCPATRGPNAPSPDVIVWTPAVQLGASISREVPLRQQRLGGSLRTTLSTTFDRVNGRVYRLVEGRAALGYAPLEEIRLLASAGASSALTGPSVTVATADLGVVISLARQIGLSLGARTVWQQSAPESTQGGGMQWAGYASINVVERGRF